MSANHSVRSPSRWKLRPTAATRPFTVSARSRPALGDPPTIRPAASVGIDGCLGVHLGEGRRAWRSWRRAGRDPAVASARPRAVPAAGGAGRCGRRATSARCRTRRGGAARSRPRRASISRAGHGDHAGQVTAQHPHLAPRLGGAAEHARPVGLPAQRATQQRGDRGQDIQATDVGGRAAGARLPRALDEQRHRRDLVDVGLGDLAPVAYSALERDGLVGGDHHQRLLPLPGLLEPRHQPADLLVGEAGLEQVALLVELGQELVAEAGRGRRSRAACRRGSPGGPDRRAGRSRARAAAPSGGTSASAAATGARRRWCGPAARAGGAGCCSAGCRSGPRAGTVVAGTPSWPPRARGSCSPAGPGR